MHPTVVAEGCDRFARTRVERDQVLAADDEETPFVAIAPLGDAARAVAAQSLAGIVGKRLLYRDSPVG